MSRRSTVWKLFSLVRYLRQRLQVSGSIPSIWFGSFNIYCPSSVSFIQWRPNATRSTCMILIARICNPVTQCFTLKDHQVHLHLGNSFKCAPVIWNHEADINPPPIFIRQFWRLWFYAHGPQLFHPYLTGHPFPLPDTPLSCSWQFRRCQFVHLFAVLFLLLSAAWADCWRPHVRAAPANGKIFIRLRRNGGRTHSTSRR